MELTQKIQKPVREPFFSRVLRPLRKLAVAAPLVASLVSGSVSCISYDLPPECRQSNSTTIRLNKPTDGKIPSWPSLKAVSSSVVVDELFIDLANETNAMSTGGMPTNVRVSIVADYCFDLAFPGPEKAGGYAHPSYHTIFLPKPVRVDSLSVLQHEIGHLQANGEADEVISQLNKVEPELMLQVLLARQSGLIDYLVDSLTLTNLRFSELLSRGVFGVPSETYNDALLFDHWRLMELNGDFGALRAEVKALHRSGQMASQIASTIAAYDEVHLPIFRAWAEDMIAKKAKILPDEWYSPVADLVLQFKAGLISEIQRRFGEVDAAMVFAANQYFPDRIAYFAVLNLGLEGMNCATLSKKNGPHESCEEDDAVCKSFGSVNRSAVSATYCCLIPASDFSGFTKHVVTATGFSYSGDAILLGRVWDKVNALTITANTQIQMDEPCRE